jgi:hypothetical protein
MISVKVEKSELEKELSSLIGRLRNRRPLFKTWAQAVSKLARRNALSHSKGGRFWLAISDSVKVDSADDSGAVVTCHHFAGSHKHKGGTIRPKNKKCLTIPISNEAVGKTSAEFALGGTPLFKPKGMDVIGYSVDGKFKAMFALRTSAVQDPEPWWPSDSDVEAIGLKEAKFWLDKQIKSA